jgi:hypothetical protein
MKSQWIDYINKYVQDHPELPVDVAEREASTRFIQGNKLARREVNRRKISEPSEVTAEIGGSIKNKRKVHMPYVLRKNRNRATYKVMNALTGKVYARATTKKKAKAQIRLLRSIHNSP